jgi:phosphate starvation-inducible PhoH-like protein
MVVAGDPSQVDLPGGTRSGLTEACHILEDVTGIGFVRFTYRDVVRHDLVTRIVKAYDTKTKSENV